MKTGKWRKMLELVPVVWGLLVAGVEKKIYSGKTAGNSMDRQVPVLLICVFCIFIILFAPSVASDATERLQRERTYSETCESFSSRGYKETLIRHLLEISIKKGVPELIPIAVMQVETRLGDNLGKPGRGISDSKLSRDGLMFLALAKAARLSPMKVCASAKLSSGGYGGAVGPGQFLPSTWAEYAGLKEQNGVVKFTSNGLLFKGDSHRDIRRLQNFFNKTDLLKLGGQLRVDGTMGKNTHKALKLFQQHIVLRWVGFLGASDGGACAQEFQKVALGGCTKLFIQRLELLMKRKRLLGDYITYDPRADRITKTLKDLGYETNQDIPNPWQPLHVAVATVLFLCDSYERNGRTVTGMVGGYYVGSLNGRNKKDARYYNHKVGATLKGIDPLGNLSDNPWNFQGCKG